MVKELISEEYNIVSGETSLTEWVAAANPKEGEQDCADLHLVKATEKGAMIVAVDGLGHGSDAVYASRKVLDCLKSSEDKSLVNLIKNCHEQLKGTRGTVLSIAYLDGIKHELSWLSVGNVEGTLMSKDENNDSKFKQLVLRNGVVGYRLPSLSVSVENIAAGDVLFFTTDGVKNDYFECLDHKKPIKEIVKCAAKNYFKNSDDSLILAVRFRNRPE